MKNNCKIYGDRDSTKSKLSFISIVVLWKKWYAKNEKKKLTKRKRRKHGKEF